MRDRYRSFAVSGRASEYMLLSLRLLFAVLLPAFVVLRTSVCAAAAAVHTPPVAATSLAIATSAGCSTAAAATRPSAAAILRLLLFPRASTAADACCHCVTARWPPVGCSHVLTTRRRPLSLFYIAALPWGVQTPGGDASFAAQSVSCDDRPLEVLSAGQQQQQTAWQRPLRQQRQSRMRQQQLRLLQQPLRLRQQPLYLQQQQLPQQQQSLHHPPQQPLRLRQQQLCQQQREQPLHLRQQPLLLQRQLLLLQQQHLHLQQSPLHFQQQTAQQQQQQQLLHPEQRQPRLPQLLLRLQQGEERPKAPQPVTQLLPALPLASELVGRSPQRQRGTGAASGWQEQLKMERRRRGLVNEEDGIAARRAAAAEALQQFTALLTKEMRAAVAALRKFPQQLPPLHRALLLLSLSRSKKLTHDRCSRLRIKQRHQQLQVFLQQQQQHERLHKQPQQQQQAPPRPQLQLQDELRRQLRIHEELDLPQQQLDQLQQEEEVQQQQETGGAKQQQGQPSGSSSCSSRGDMDATAAQRPPLEGGRKHREKERQLLFEKEKQLLQGKASLPDIAVVYNDLRALYIELVSQGKAHAAQVRRCTRSRQVEQRYAEAVNALRKAISLRSDALLNYRLFSSYIQLHAQQRCSLHRLAPQLPQLLLVGGPNVGKSSLFAALAAANQYVRERSRLQLRQLTAQAEAAAGATRVTAAATTKGAAANLPAGRTGGEFTSETAACTQRAPAAVSSTRKAAVDANAGRKTEKDGEEDSGGGRGWELADTWRLERRAMAVGRAFAFRAAAAAAEDEDAVATAAEAIAALPLDSAGDSATRAAEAAAATAIVAPYEFSTQGLVVAKVVERRKREMSSSDTLANLQTATLPTYRSVGQLIDGPPLLLRKEGEHGRNVFEKISLTVLSHLPCGVLFLFDASRLPRRQLSEQQLQLLKQQPTSESLQQGLLAFEDQEQEDEKERREGDECDISAGAAAPTSQSLVTYPVADNPHRGDHSGVTGEEPVSCFEFSPSSNNNRRGYTAEGVSGSTTRGETRGQGMVKKKKNKGSCPLHLLQQLELRNQLRQRFPKRPWIDVITKADLLDAAQLQTARAVLPPCLLLSTHRSIESLLQVQRHARLLLHQLNQIAEQRTASAGQERLVQQQYERQRLQELERQRINEALRFYAETAKDANKSDGP